MAGDRRDEQTWVTVELTHSGQQRVEEGLLEDDIVEALDAPWHWPVFVPARTYVRGGRKVTVHLFEGYAFIGTGYEENRYFSLERGRSAKYFKKIMSTDTLRGIRVLHTVDNSKIEEWRQLLHEEVNNDIQEGMRAVVTEGKLTNLEVLVLDVDGEFANIMLELRSTHCITRVPKYFLDVV